MGPAPQTTPAKLSASRAGAGPGRLLSLDVFRGLTIAAMILVNSPGSPAVYRQLEHADWNGWTFADLVFPFFLWIIGVAITISMAGRLERGAGRRALLLHVARRSAILFVLGLFINAFPRFDLHSLRIPGTLQRIAVCYFCAALIHLWTGLRGRVIAIVGLLAGYWCLMTMVPVPGYGPGVLDKHGNLAQYVDQIFFAGRMYRGQFWDPEGIVSTIPAIATTLLGTLAGLLLQATKRPFEKAALLLAAGNALLYLGLVMNHWLPINKNLWTSTFAVFMAGMAAVIFGVCYWILDVRLIRGWAKPFAIFGRNALAIYALSEMLSRLLDTVQVTDAGMRVPLQQFLFQHLFAGRASAPAASLLYAASMVVLLWLVAWVMYRRKYFVKL
jgi:predicted acyltransferase